MKQAYLIELLNKEDKRLELPPISDFDIFLHRSNWGNYMLEIITSGKDRSWIILTQ